MLAVPKAAKARAPGKTGPASESQVNFEVFLSEVDTLTQGIMITHDDAKSEQHVTVTSHVTVKFRRSEVPATRDVGL